MGRNLADVEYKMRMTAELKEKIVSSAKSLNRSMNADIIARLEKSFELEQEQNPEPPKRTPQVYSDFIHDVIGVNEKVIEQIADKVAERLKEK